MRYKAALVLILALALLANLAIAEEPASLATDKPPDTIIFHEISNLPIVMTAQSSIQQLPSQTLSGDPWWDESWQKRKLIEITTFENISPYVTYTIELDTEELITNELLDPLCRGLRIVWYNRSSNENVDLNYIILDCNDRNSEISFKSQNYEDLNTLVKDYYAYYDNIDAPFKIINKSKVYFYYEENFDNLTWNYYESDSNYDHRLGDKLTLIKPASGYYWGAGHYSDHYKYVYIPKNMNAVISFKERDNVAECYYGSDYDHKLFYFNGVKYLDQSWCPQEGGDINWHVRHYYVPSLPQGNRYIYQRLYTNKHSRCYGGGCEYYVEYISIRENAGYDSSVGIEDDVYCQGSCADLTMSNLTIISSDISLRVKNLGNLDINKTKITFLDTYLSDIIKTKTIVINETLFGSSFKDINTSWDLSENHILRVFVDPDNEVIESNELNNFLTKEYSSVPKIDNIKTEYNGTFISKVFLQNEVTVSVSDANGDVQEVIFSYSNQTIVDDDGSDGWSNDINMGYLTHLDNKLKITAVDLTGNSSELHVTEFNVLEIPSWLPNIEAGFATFNVSELMFILDTGGIPKPPFKWVADIPESIPIIGGRKVIKFYTSLYAYFKLIGQAYIKGDIFSDIKLTENAEMDIAGGVEGICSENFEFEEANFDLSIDATVDIPTPYTLPKSVPIIGGTGIYVTLNPHGHIVSIFEVSETNGTLDFKDLTGELGLGVGLTMKIDLNDLPIPVEAEIYIQADGTIVIKYPPMELEQIIATFELGAEIIVGSYTFEFTYAPDPYIYPEPPEPGPALLLSSVPEEPSWKLLSYNNHPYYSNLDLSMPLAIQALGPVPINNLAYEDSYPDNYPYLFTNRLRTERLMTWVHTKNITTIPPETDVYSLWYTNEWEDLFSVSDNSNGELSPVGVIDERGWPIFAWVSEKTKVNGSTKIEEWLSDLEIYFSPGWQTPIQITNNSFTDGSPSMDTDYDGNTLVVWSADIDNNLSTNKDMEIRYSLIQYDYDESKYNWSTPLSITNNSVQDLDPSVGYETVNDALVVWTKDTDGNSSTDNDKEIYYSIFNGTVSSETALTNDSRKDSNAKIAFHEGNNTGVILWVKEKIVTFAHNYTNDTTNITNTTYYNQTLNEIFFAEYNDGVILEPNTTGIVDYVIDDLSLSMDLRNNLIVLWKNFKKNGSIAYTVRGSDEIWSPMKLLVDNQEFSSKPTIITNNSFAIVVWLQHSTIKTNRTIDNKTFYNVSVATDNDIFYTEHFIESDLIVSLDWVTLNYSYPDLGDTINVTATVKNIGDISTEDSVLDFWDETRGISYGVQQLGSIAPGQNKTASIEFNLTEIKHELIIECDKPGIEINHSNNDILKEISTVPDLYVQSVLTSVYNPNVGDNITIVATINTSTLRYASDINVSFYEGDPELNGTLLSKKNIDYIDKTEPAKLSIEWTATSGVHDIFIIIDKENNILESTKVNNIAVRTFKVLPDLLIDSIIFYNKSNISADVRLINLNSVNESNMTLAIYDGHPLINGTLINKILVDNLTEEKIVTLEINPNTINNKIYAYIDSDNTIDEKREDNNIYTENAFLSALPDLKISEIILNITNESIFEISTNIQNIGNGTAFFIKISYFNQSFGLIGETMLDFIENSSNKSSSLNVNITLQNITIVIDSTDDTRELNESNNIATKSPFEEAIFILTLKKDWNLFSIPIKLTNNSVKNIFKEENITIFGYNTSWYVPEYIDVKSGYWVKVNETQNLTLTGIEIADKNITLNAGWNLVGYPYLAQHNNSEIYSNTTVYTFNGSWYSYISQRTFNSINLLKPGYAYWVLV